VSEPYKLPRKKTVARRMMDNLALKLHTLAESVDDEYYGPCDVDYVKHLSDIRQMRSDIETIQTFLNQIKECHRADIDQQRNVRRMHRKQFSA
jgi:hypothetical protein